MTPGLGGVAGCLLRRRTAEKNGAQPSSADPFTCNTQSSGAHSPTGAYLDEAAGGDTCRCTPTPGAGAVERVAERISAQGPAQPESRQLTLFGDSERSFRKSPIGSSRGAQADCRETTPTAMSRAVETETSIPGLPVASAREATRESARDRSEAPPQPSGLPSAPQAEVPDELITLCRHLWTVNVARKAAQRYVGGRLTVGDPPATVDEISRYLRWSAGSSRVQRARFPVAAACMPEEFADWLQRSRRLRAVPSAADSPEAVVGRSWPPTRSNNEAALTGSDLAKRASEFCRQLGGHSSRGDRPGLAKPPIAPDANTAAEPERRRLNA